MVAATPAWGSIRGMHRGGCGWTDESARGCRALSEGRGRVWGAVGTGANGGNPAWVLGWACPGPGVELPGDPVGVLGKQPGRLWAREVDGRGRRREPGAWGTRGEFQKGHPGCDVSYGLRG